MQTWEADSKNALHGAAVCHMFCTWGRVVRRLVTCLHTSPSATSFVVEASTCCQGIKAGCGFKLYQLVIRINIKYNRKLPK